MKPQKGAALVVVLSLLTVSLMVGLSSIQSSQVDERLAGNYRTQSELQMAAENAVSKALSGFSPSESPFKSHSDEGGGYNLEDFVSGSWKDFEKIKSYEGVVKSGSGVDMVYRYAYFSDLGGSYIMGLAALVGNGEASGGVKKVFAMSEVVVAAYKPFSFTGLEAALTILGGILRSDQPAVWQPNSDGAIVGGGMYITKDDEGNDVVLELSSLAYEAAEEIETIDEDKFGSGVKYYGEPSLSTSERVKDIYETFKSKGVHVVEGNVSAGGNDNGVEIGGNKVGQCSSSQGNKVTPASPDFVIVEGELSITGGAQFCGVMIALGGKVTLGGNTVINGMVLAANYSKEGGGYNFDVPSDVVDLVFSGGGNAGSVRFDESIVTEALKKYMPGEEVDLSLLFGKGESSMGELVYWQ